MYCAGKPYNEIDVQLGSVPVVLGLGVLLLALGKPISMTKKEFGGVALRLPVKRFTSGASAKVIGFAMCS